MQVTIRYAQYEDYNEIESLMQEVQTLHTKWRPDIYKSVDTILPYDAFLTAVKQQTLIAAEIDKRVVGIMSYTVRHIDYDAQLTRNVVFIDAMAVDSSYRRQGIGHQLFDFINDFKTKNNYDGIELQVNAKNTAAREMYSKYGFTEKTITMELIK